MAPALSATALGKTSDSEYTSFISKFVSPKSKCKEEAAVNLYLTGSRPETDDRKFKPNVVDNITKRLANDVYDSEDRRRAAFIPLDQEIWEPHERDVSAQLKGDLDVALQKCANEGSSWDAMLTSEIFQKRMQFLREHAKTGQFIERYGTEGYYDGDFLYGMRHGKGKHVFRNQVYEGEWKWDMRHGWGELTEADGTICRCEWAEGRQHGFGKIINPDGVAVFEGEFKFGKRHGLGRQIFENHDIYDGGWCEGRLHDRGVYYFHNGDKLYGMWDHGVYHGIGVFHYADGSISRREYKEGLLMSVQDYEYSTCKFGMRVTRDGMQKHTKDPQFPHDIFMMSN